MLAIIEHEQEMPVADAVRERLRRDPLAAELQFQHAGHRGRRESGVGKRRQFDEPRAILEVGEQIAGGLNGKHGLSDPPRAGQGHHAIGGDEVTHVLHRRRPADELADDRWKIGGRARCGLGGGGRDVASVVSPCRTVQSPTSRYPRPCDVFNMPRSLPSALRTADM